MIIKGSPGRLVAFAVLLRATARRRSCASGPVRSAAASVLESVLEAVDSARSYKVRFDRCAADRATALVWPVWPGRVIAEEVSWSGSAAALCGGGDGGAEGVGASTGASGAATTLAGAVGANSGALCCFGADFAGCDAKACWLAMLLSLLAPAVADVPASSFDRCKRASAPTPPAMTPIAPATAIT